MSEERKVDPAETYTLDDDELADLDGLRLTRLLEALNVSERSVEEESDQE